MSISKKSKLKRVRNVACDDETPEIVHANADEVLKLRELHEMSSLPLVKKRIVRKNKPKQDVENFNFIDSTVLEACANVHSEGDLQVSSNLNNTTVQNPQPQISSKKM